MKLHLNLIDVHYTKVLGIYRPDFSKVYNQIINMIRKDLHELTGFTNWADVRDPDKNAGLESLIHNWHQDCSGYADFVIIWSNTRPTLVKAIHGNPRFHKPRAFEIVAINNKTCLHKAQPLSKRHKLRWSAVTRVNIVKGRLEQ